MSPPCSQLLQQPHRRVSRGLLSRLLLCVDGGAAADGGGLGQPWTAPCSSCPAAALGRGCFSAAASSARALRSRTPVPPPSLLPRPQALPYELRALEAALLAVTQILHQEVAALEGTTHPGERARPHAASQTSASPRSPRASACLPQRMMISLCKCPPLCLCLRAVLARIRRSVARPDLERLYGESAHPGAVAGRGNTHMSETPAASVDGRRQAAQRPCGAAPRIVSPLIASPPCYRRQPKQAGQGGGPRGQGQGGTKGKGWASSTPRASAAPRCAACPDLCLSRTLPLIRLTKTQEILEELLDDELQMAGMCLSR